MYTSLGDIDVELWPKEAPKAVRNFVQLCLEGYYDKTIFHRMSKDFLVQGGDPTGTGQGGESIYGHPFKDEFHTRLRFTHRGLVACANKNEPDTNGSQFFITLDKTETLDRTSTIFGTVRGETLFNLMRFNELLTDANDTPVEPPILYKTEVLLNPFIDIIPRCTRQKKEAEAAAAEAAAKEAERKESKRLGRDLKLISFGEEMEHEESETRMKSAHDMLNDAKLSREAALEVDLRKVKERIVLQQSKGSPGHLSEKTKDMEAELKDRIEESRRRQLHHVVPLEMEEETIEEEGAFKKKPPISLLDKRKESTRSKSAALAPSRHMMSTSETELLTEWERRRNAYKERKRVGGNREKETLSKLTKFSAGLKVNNVPPLFREGTDVHERSRDVDSVKPAAWRVEGYLEDLGEDDVDLASLRKHALTFSKDAWRVPDALDDYSVEDMSNKRAQRQ